MRPNQRRLTGRVGELIAADYLKKKGYVIRASNWRSMYGEIDLIAEQDGTLAFVEVKTRASKSLGPPEISITPRKAQHMRDAALSYFQQHQEINPEWRIDLITVQINSDSAPVIDHFENVIQ